MLRGQVYTKLTSGCAGNGKRFELGQFFDDAIRTGCLRSVLAADGPASCTAAAGFPKSGIRSFSLRAPTIPADRVPAVVR